MSGLIWLSIDLTLSRIARKVKRMGFEFLPIKTRVVMPPRDEVWDILDGLDVREGDIIFITSKILAIHQGRTMPTEGTDKGELIRREADYWAEFEPKCGFKVNLTIRDNVLGMAAGIDESNAGEYYVLLPKDVDKLCAEIRARICKRTGIKSLGVVCTDSHTQPMRLGVMGISIGFAGIAPLDDLRGRPDIFGREMKFAQVNRLDSLVAMAVLQMGECAEQIPVVILRGYTAIEFSTKYGMPDVLIEPELDIYRPLLDVLVKPKSTH